MRNDEGIDPTARAVHSDPSRAEQLPILAGTNPLTTEKRAASDES